MHQRRLSPRFRWRALLLATLLLATARTTLGHEVPERAALFGFVARSGLQLQLLLRVPLETMRDLDFPVLPNGTLDVVRARPLLSEAAQLWLAPSLLVEANGARLSAPVVAAARLALPNDQSFTSYRSAQASFRAPELANEISLPWRQALLDVMLVYTLPDSSAHLTLRPQLAHLGIRTTTVLHVITSDSADRILTYRGNPGVVSLEPKWHEAALRFVIDGFQHILRGLDHILFVICLVLPIRRLRSLVAIVTAFTIAHSLTLGAAALGFAPTSLWFPPLVETAIALSIVWLALENVLLATPDTERRWVMAFCFGLVHGFGFSFALQENLQFAGAHLALALAAFNVGVEVGQLLLLAIAVPMLMRLTRYAGAGRDRIVIVVGSVVIAHTAWHWMADRAGSLGAFLQHREFPQLDAALLLATLRVALFLAIAAAVALITRQAIRRIAGPPAT